MESYAELEEYRDDLCLCAPTSPYFSYGIFTHLAEVSGGSGGTEAGEGWGQPARFSLRQLGPGGGGRGELGLLGPRLEL